MTNIGDTGFCLPIISQKRSYSGELFFQVQGTASAAAPGAVALYNN